MTSSGGRQARPTKPARKTLGRAILGVGLALQGDAEAPEALPEPAVSDHPDASTRIFLPEPRFGGRGVGGLPSAMHWDHPGDVSLDGNELADPAILPPSPATGKRRLVAHGQSLPVDQAGTIASTPGSHTPDALELAPAEARSGAAVTIAAGESAPSDTSPGNPAAAAQSSAGTGLWEQPDVQALTLNAASVPVTDGDRSPSLEPTPHDPLPTVATAVISPGDRLPLPGDHAVLPAADPAPSRPIIYTPPAPGPAWTVPSVATRVAPARPATVAPASQFFRHSKARRLLPRPSFGHASGSTPESSRPHPALPAALPPTTAKSPLRQITAPGIEQVSRRLDLPRPEFGLATGSQPSGSSPDGNVVHLASEGKSAARAPGVSAFNADDELILQISTDNGGLADTITAYGTRTAVYLPLGEISRLMDLAIVVSDEGHYASGWAIDQSRTVSVNLREGSLRQGNAQVSLTQSDAAAFDGELYLRADLFARLLPLTLHVDLRAQTVTIKTLTPFPFEQRQARDSARERLAARSSSAGVARRMREDTPWMAITVPLGDVELRGASDSTLGTRSETDIRLAGDLAFMTARTFASFSSRDRLSAARLELGRRDPDARLLGPLRATEFQLGDVSTPSLPLGLRGIGGRGVTVTNAPLEKVSVFDKIDLRGDLPDGYEAELYRNNTLIGSTRTAVNGQYQFLQIPVEFGLNVFRLALYGPQGQRREEVRQISVGDGRLARGQAVYSLGIAQREVNLFDVHAANFSPGPDRGAWRMTAQLQYGLTRGVTASVAGGVYDQNQQRRWMASSGIRFGISGVAAKLDAGIQDSGGHAVTAGASGKTGNTNWTITHAEYSGSFSDELQAFTADPLRRATEFDLSTSLRFGSSPGRWAIPLAGRVRQIQFADGRIQTDASLRASAMVSRLLVSNGLIFSRAKTPGEAGNMQLAGTFDLATFAGSRTQYRASLLYSALPHLNLSAAQFEIDHALDSQTAIKGSFGHVLTTGTSVIGISALRRFSRWTMALDGNVSVPTHSYTVTMRLGFSFGRNPLTRSFFIARPGLASSGAIAVRAFHDKNGDGRFEDDEAPLSDVSFTTGTADGRTNRLGVALIGGVGDGNRSSLHIDRETLPDIALAPVSDGIEFVPRAGRIHVSQFAIQELSEIEGTAQFGEQGRGVSGLLLRLVGARGNTLMRTRSGAGGTFLFEQVPPGDYLVELDPDQATRLSLKQRGAANIKVGKTSSVLAAVIQIETKSE